MAGRDVNEDDVAGRDVNGDDVAGRDGPVCEPGRLPSPRSEPRSEEPTGRLFSAPASISWCRWICLGLAVALLLLVGVLGESAAKPGLGPRGWAPGALPWALDPAWTTAALAAAYLLGAVAVALGLWRPPSRPWPWWAVLGLGGLVLLTQPFGSADHTNYAAYGQIALQGGDPYAVAPADWAGGIDPVTSAVQPPYSLTPSIYGPVATILSALAAWGGHDNLRQVVWCWQVIVVLAWVGVRWLARRLTDDRARVDVLWTANPIVLGIAVLGAHVDIVATVLAMAALVVANRRGWTGVVAAGALTGLAASTKITYGVVGLALVLAWVTLRRRVLLPTLVLSGAALLVAVPLHVWAGPHVFEQLSRSRRSVSFATPWRPVLELLRGHGPEAVLRTVILVAAGLVCVVLALALWRLTRGLAPGTPTGQAARATAVLTTAYALGAPYSLPWYDELAWATLPALMLGALDVVVLTRGTVMALAYVPGRVVGMTATVEAVTLGARRHVAPWLVLVTWGGVLWAAARIRDGVRSGPAASGSGSSGTRSRPGAR